MNTMLASAQVTLTAATEANKAAQSRLQRAQRDWQRNPTGLELSIARQQADRAYASLVRARAQFRRAKKEAGL